MRDLILPWSNIDPLSLKAGEMVFLSGRVAVARDAAHKLMVDTGIYPFDPGEIPVFYMGPSPAPPGRACGSCGPTTSARMEPFIPSLLEKGMKVAIGKGDMSLETRKLFTTHKAIYLAAAGGAGALASTRILSRKVIAWEHLGPEAVSLVELDRLPVFVAWDLHGGNIYSINRRKK